MADVARLAIMRKELTMRHTAWIDDCCRVLQDEQEYATDADAITLIHVRRLALSVGDTFSYDDPTLIRSQSEALIQMSINGFKKELEKLTVAPVSSQTHSNCE